MLGGSPKRGELLETPKGQGFTQSFVPFRVGFGSKVFVVMSDVPPHIIVRASSLAAVWLSTKNRPKYMKSQRNLAGRPDARARSHPFVVRRAGEIGVGAARTATANAQRAA